MEVALLLVNLGDSTALPGMIFEPLLHTT